MPRVVRLDTPGLLHHVKIRGIERRRIFNDNEDRENLIERLSMLLPKIKIQCYAWLFMLNHTHLLFRSGPSAIRGEKTTMDVTDFIGEKIFVIYVKKT